MKKTALLLATLLLLTVCVLPLTGCIGTAFVVDGLRVETEELLYVMRDMQATVMFELEEEFGVNAEVDDFWTAPQNGVDMLLELQKRAQDVIILEKVEQMLAEDEGIHSEMVYSAQLRELEAINIERSRAAAAGEIIYGPVKRNFLAYKSSMMSDLRRDLLQRYKDNGVLTVTDKQLNEEFEKRKEDLLENNTEEVARGRLLDELYEDAYDALLAEKAANAEVSVKVTVTYEMLVDYE